MVILGCLVLVERLKYLVIWYLFNQSSGFGKMTCLSSPWRQIQNFGPVLSIIWLVSHTPSTPNSFLGLKNSDSFWIHLIAPKCLQRFKKYFFFSKQTKNGFHLLSLSLSLALCLSFCLSLSLSRLKTSNQNSVNLKREKLVCLSVNVKY